MLKYSQNINIPKHPAIKISEKLVKKEKKNWKSRNGLYLKKDPIIKIIKDELKPNWLQHFEIKHLKSSQHCLSIFNLMSTKQKRAASVLIFPCKIKSKYSEDFRFCERKEKFSELMKKK